MRTFWHLLLVTLSLLAAVPSANAQELIDRRQRRDDYSQRQRPRVLHVITYSNRSASIASRLAALYAG